VETKAGEIGIGKTKEGGSKRGSREEIRRERQEKGTEKREDDGSKESGGRMGNLG